MLRNFLRNEPWQRRVAAAIFLSVVVAALGLVVALALASEPTPQPGEIVPDTYAPPSDFDIEAEIERQRAEEAKAGGTTKSSSVGIESAGSTIQIAGEEIQLPPDAYISNITYTHNCPYGCLPLPVLIIRRGDSTIRISGSTGEVDLEEVPPGEEGAFDFLDGVRRPFKQSETFVDSNLPSNLTLEVDPTPQPGELVPDTYAPPGETVPARPAGGPTPTPYMTPWTPPPDFDVNAEIERQRAEEAKAGGTTKSSSVGLESAGTIIEIAGEKIQLPPDAYVANLIQTHNCPYGCLPLPVLIIRRGDSTIRISGSTGEVDLEEIQPGEEGAFDFLDGVRRPFNP